MLPPVSHGANFFVIINCMSIPRLIRIFVCQIWFPSGQSFDDHSRFVNVLTSKSLLFLRVNIYFIFLFQIMTFCCIMMTFLFPETTKNAPPRVSRSHFFSIVYSHMIPHLCVPTFVLIGPAFWSPRLKCLIFNSQNAP